MKKKKEGNYISYSKYFIIPLILCMAIIACGIIMTILNQSGEGYGKAYGIGQAKTYAPLVEFFVSGPSVIISGLLASAFIGYFWIDYRVGLKKKDNTFCFPTSSSS